MGPNKGSGTSWINCDTTRVDALGLRFAIYLYSSSTSYVASVGKMQSAFAEPRLGFISNFISYVPAAFDGCATFYYPYRIVEPGTGAGFGTGGPNQNYYNSYETQIWDNNGITDAFPGPNLGINNSPLQAAIARHVGAAAGSFDISGNLINPAIMASASLFYTAEPCDDYAKFIHSIAINGFAYGFPYDDNSGYSSDISCNNPDYVVLAIGN